MGGELTRDAIEGPALIPWRSAAALAQAPDAEALAAEEHALAARFGAPRALGRALRVLAVVGAAPLRTERCRAAVAVLSPCEARLEYAHALCDLGASLRRERARRAAREPLREALDLAVRCGAAALARRAREELAASGARPRRLAQSGRDALTPAELRVARLAARGVANREIARTLVVTVKTVETELSHAYAKLGIRSRRELRGRAANGLGLGPPRGSLHGRRDVLRHVRPHRQRRSGRAALSRCLEQTAVEVEVRERRVLRDHPDSRPGALGEMVAGERLGQHLALYVRCSAAVASRPRTAWKRVTIALIRQPPSVDHNSGPPSRLRPCQLRPASTRRR